MIKIISVGRKEIPANCQFDLGIAKVSLSTVFHPHSHAVFCMGHERFGFDFPNEAIEFAQALNKANLDGDEESLDKLLETMQEKK